ncbi:MAG: hypothetical protein M1821_002334 [Bathelium mastoideum]|nr:MAG: hypothetical protein M1821_002334 [Bathelium mastoideum]
MFEDINHSGDGGIYAELIQNRAFQGSSVFPSTLDAWSSIGADTLSLQNLSNPVSSALPTSMNVAVANGTTGQVGFSNTGWWGFDVQVQDYQGSFYVHGTYNGTVTVSLVSYLSNDTFGTVKVPVQSTANDWTQFNYTLTPSTAAPNPNNTFILTFDAGSAADGSLDFNLISLFPPTYKNRANGNRVDLMEALAGLNPSFLRLPGGNNLEGNDPPYLWYWNLTIGPLENRPGRPGTWGYENTDGLGLIEYLYWCQDLDIEPILAVWGGEYLDGTIISNDTIDVYVQYALDELEFLMGDASTTYGAQRIALGYPDPFQINYVEVGNEDNLNNGLESYQDYRFPAFYDAISSAYPNITIIASTIALDPFPGNASGDYHQYTLPDYFVSQFNFFDNYTSQHPILLGEYATVQQNLPGNPGVNFSNPRVPFPFWIGSVGEAVYLLGAERNADKIIGASYAPTLQNLNSYEWAPDLISYSADPSQDVLSTSWHMISFLSSTRLTNTLPTNNATIGPVYYVAGQNTNTGSSILKAAVYNSTGDVAITVSFDGVAAGTNANLTYLYADDATAYNNVSTPNVVQVNSSTVTSDANGVFSFSLPDLSVAILETEQSTYPSGKIPWGPAGWKAWKNGEGTALGQIKYGDGCEAAMAGQGCAKWHGH